MQKPCDYGFKGVPEPLSQLLQPPKEQQEVLATALHNTGTGCHSPLRALRSTE